MVCLFVWIGGTLTAAPATKGGSDRAQWLGPNRDGISSESGWRITGSPKVLWKKSIGWGFSSVAVSDGKLYTMGNTKVGGKDTDHVYCFDAVTGRELWKKSYPCRLGQYKGPRTTPTVDGGMVYTLSREGYLMCLDAKNGNIRWKKNVPNKFKAKPSGWGFACSPLVLGNLLILDVGPTIALNKATGRLVWKSKSSKAGYSSPIAFKSGATQYIASFPEHGLVILNAKNGATIADYRWKTKHGANVATPIISGDKIFISSGYNRGCAMFRFNGRSLTKVWENKNMRNHCNNSVLWKDHLYGFDGQAGGRGTLRCLELATGDVKWSHRSLVTGSLMIADGKLIVLGGKGTLISGEASPSGFKPTAKAKPVSGRCWTVPVLANGRLYCRNNEGDLLCLDVSGK